jgi:hypothetical protein
MTAYVAFLELSRHEIDPNSHWAAASSLERSDRCKAFRSQGSAQVRPARAATPSPQTSWHQWQCLARKRRLRALLSLMPITPEPRHGKSPEPIQQCFGILENRRIEPFGEPAVDGREQIAGLAHQRQYRPQNSADEHKAAEFAEKLKRCWLLRRW